MIIPNPILILILRLRFKYYVKNEKCMYYNIITFNFSTVIYSNTKIPICFYSRL